MGWQHQPSEPIMLGPRTKAGAETHKQPKLIHPPCFALPPLSSTWSSISFPALAALGCSSPCHSLFGGSVPAPAAACSKSSTSTELPAWGKGKDSVQKPLCDIWKQSSAFTCYIQMESGMLWSTEWSGLDEDTQLKLNWGKGKFLASLITAWN